ncbi:hypothetical protein HA466_0205880 [Hirschfeldia incana]|nr:hypothetical protein HA466_0205880 [Hirschfeldia incana]
MCRSNTQKLLSMLFRSLRCFSDFESLPHFAQHLCIRFEPRLCESKTKTMSPHQALSLGTLLTDHLLMVAY